MESGLLEDLPPSSQLQAKKRRRWFIGGAIVASILVTGLCVGLALRYAQNRSREDSSEDGSIVYLNEGILRAVNLANVYNDSKTFVDMPLRNPPTVVRSRFNMIDSSSVDAVRDWLLDNFYPAGYDVVAYLPEDFNSTYDFSSAVADPTLLQWAQQVNNIWPTLSREVNARFKLYPGRTSLLDIPSPFIIPGGRFREFYYWDNYFIVQGLLRSRMFTTARRVITNLLHFVSRYGFVPNGGRLYYLTRSQPPLLSEMVYVYYHVTSDASLVRTALPLLIKEYNWWMQLGRHAVQVSKGGQTYVLNRYFADTPYPRPEGWRPDNNLAQTLPADANRTVFFSNVVAGAETGWDFSSRWFNDPNSILSINTRNVLPADLNAFLCRAERRIASFCALTGADCATTFENAHAARVEAMRAVMFNATDGVWHDVHADTLEMSTEPTLASYLGIWAQCYNTSDGAVMANAFETLRKSNLVQVGGMAVTGLPTGQQWDFPNSWAPLQYFVAEPLFRGNDPGSVAFGMSLVQSWLRSVYRTFKNTGFMFEKFNSTSVGDSGSGGEYIVQVVSSPS